jgi:hypothetical protein
MVYSCKIISSQFDSLEMFGTNLVPSNLWWYQHEPLFAWQTAERCGVNGPRNGHAGGTCRSEGTFCNHLSLNIQVPVGTWRVHLAREPVAT